MALNPVHLLAVTARVELHSGGQAGLPDCLAPTLVREMYLAPFSFGKTWMLYKMLYYCLLRKEESPYGLWTVPLNNIPHRNSMTSVINFSRTKNPALLSTYKSFFAVLSLWKWQICRQLTKFITSELHLRLTHTPWLASLWVFAVILMSHWLGELDFVSGKDRVWTGSTCLASSPGHCYCLELITFLLAL